MTPTEPVTRRPLKSRDSKWASGTARLLTRTGLTPNAISVIGIFFAAAAGACLILAGRSPHDGHFSLLLILAILGMQCRLLCNLFDGMVAIEGGLKTKSGELFNELPDRFSDAFIFIGAAYCAPSFAWNVELGWSAAVLSVTTAYVRALGASMGAGQHFIGPMAKQHRMALMTIACLIAAFTPLCPALAHTFPIALTLVVAGCLVTIFRRSARIISVLEAK